MIAGGGERPQVESVRALKFLSMTERPAAAAKMRPEGRRQAAGAGGGERLQVEGSERMQVEGQVEGQPQVEGSNERWSPL